MPGWGLFVTGYMAGVTTVCIVFYLWLVKQSENP